LTGWAGQSTIQAMGFNRRKLEDQRREAAEKEAATDAQELEDAERLIATWNERQAKRMPMLFSPTIGAAVTAGYWFVWVRCPACRTTNAIDLRTLDRHALSGLHIIANLTLAKLFPRERHLTPIEPVDLGKIGPEVSNLHKGLLFLIVHQPGISENDRKMLQARSSRPSCASRGSGLRPRISLGSGRIC